MTFVVAHVPSGFFVRNCPSRRPRRISKTKNGLPSDLTAIFAASSSARCSERRLSRSSSTRSFAPRRGSRMRDTCSPRSTCATHAASISGRAVPTSRMRCPGTASASDANSARPSSGAKWRSSISTIVGRCAANDRVAWTKTVCSESFVSGSAPAGATSPRRSAANAGTSSGVCGSAARIDGLVVAEVLAVGGGERARRRRRAAGRVAAEEEVHVLARLREPPDELVHEPRLADPRLALDEDDLSVAGLRRVEERAQPRELRVAPVERRLARDADAPQRTPRVGADRLRAVLPPRGAPRPARASSSSAAADAKRASRSFSSRRRSTSSKNGESCGLSSPAGRGTSSICRRMTTCEVVVVERVLPRRELVERQAERVEVGAAVDAAVATSELLRRRVAHRADEGAGLRHAQRLVLDARDAEVHHLDDVVGRDEDVVGLQVAVHGARRVDRRERLRDLAADVAAELLGTRVEVRRAARAASGPRRTP